MIITLIRPINDEEADELGMGEDIDLIFHGTKEQCIEFLEEKDGSMFIDGEYHLIEKNLTDIEQ